MASSGSNALRRRSTEHCTHARRCRIVQFPRHLLLESNHNGDPVRSSLRLAMTIRPPAALAAGKLGRRSHLLIDFLMVAAEGGIRQAALRANLSQSAMTRRIQDLEDALGVALFERSARGMSLTAFGRALEHHARLVDLACHYAAGEIDDLLDGRSGVLRIAAGPAWAYGIVPDVIARLHAEFPRVQVSLLNRMNESTLPLLSAGRIDAVLGGLPEAGTRDPDVVHEPLLEIEHRVFAGIEHPLSKRRRIRPAEMRDYGWIWFDESVSARALFAAMFRGAGVEPPPSAVETSSVQAGIRLMRQGHYLMVLPSTLHPIAQANGLRVLDCALPIGRFAAGIMYRPSVLRLRAFARFRELLMREVTSLAPMP
ncbi:MAG: LysR family transcriptional regulator [Burkholderiales bacterium]|nr:LysR family transcriptional regulator [Burkholderiales bacterium]